MNNCKICGELISDEHTYCPECVSLGLAIAWAGEANDEEEDDG